MKYVRYSLTINALQKSDDPGSFLLGSRSRQVFIFIEVRRWSNILVVLVVIIQIIRGGCWRGLVVLTVMLVVGMSWSRVSCNFPHVVSVSVTAVTPP